MNMRVQQALFPFALDQAPPEPRPGSREYAERQLAEALAGPDPVDERMPRVGDVIEVLWTHYPSKPWARGEVIDIWRGIMTVRMTSIGPHVLWDAPLTHADARRIYSMVNRVWRWPRREEAIA